MKKHVVILFITAVLAGATVVHAVTYPFPGAGPVTMAHDAVLRAGARVYLFQSGTTDVKNSIRSDDLLAVYREYPPDFSVGTREAGRVKVLYPLGDYYFMGEVTEGEVQPGFLAKKGGVACIITPLTPHHQS